MCVRRERQSRRGEQAPGGAFHPRGRVWTLSSRQWGAMESARAKDETSFQQDSYNSMSVISLSTWKVVEFKGEMNRRNKSPWNYQMPRL